MLLEAVLPQSCIRRDALKQYNAALLRFAIRNVDCLPCLLIICDVECPMSVGLGLCCFRGKLRMIKSLSPVGRWPAAGRPQCLAWIRRTAPGPPPGQQQLLRRKPQDAGCRSAETAAFDTAAELASPD